MCLSKIYTFVVVNSYNQHILDIIHRPALYLKDGVSESGFCVRLQVEPTLPDSEISSIYWAQLSSCHLDKETESL
jgi:hypothetical protein